MSIFNVLKNIKYMLSIVAKNTPLYFFSVIVFNIVDNLITTMISVYLVKQIFNSIESQSFSNVMLFVGIMAIFQISNQILQSVFKYKIVPIQKLRLHSKLHAKLFVKACEIDLECYDFPDFYNDFILSLNEIDERANSVINDFGKLLARILSIIAISYLLVSIEPLLLLITIFIVILSSVLQQKINKISFSRNISINPQIRKNDYIVRVFYMKDYSKELRLNNLSKILFKKFDESTNEMNNAVLNHNRKVVLINIISIMFTSSLFDMGVMLLFAFRMMVTKVLTLGDYASGINAIWQLRNHLSCLINCYSSFQNNSQYIERLKVFINYKPNIVSLSKARISKDCSAEITFKNVCFGYKNENTILKNINFTINTGEKIAIVGLNGAGKTTLIKLLLRLYEPLSGSVEFNNININKYEIQKYRSGFGIVFQDYNLYYATLAENISMDDIFDENVIEYSLQKSGFYKKNVDINTIITREFNNEGVVLSGGESQKVAISRAFAHSFHTLILDEPSSALDPIAEYKFNKMLLESSKDKTVILISHRLSTTRIADRILFLDNGEIIEAGTHNELMNKKGKYAEMFNIQSKKYVNY